jgi:carboxyl-terminal processing protease
MPLALRPAAVFVRASTLPFILLLAACVEHQSLPNDPTGRLFARGLDEITDLYIGPVSSRKLILAGASRLSRLDGNFSVTESAGTENKTQIALSYSGREVVVYPTPADDEPHAWGALMGRLIANAKAVSPTVAGLSEDQIDKALFDGITGALDRFSRYAAPETARDQRAARDGFGGIGITLELAGGEFRVTQVTSGGPAALAGIRPDDRLIAIDGVDIARRSQSDVVHALRGPISSPVEVTVFRPNPGQKRSFRLQRALVILPTVTMSRDGNIAVFQVASFNQNTTQQIVEDLGRLDRDVGHRLGGIILDLRGNPGGLLDQAVSLSDVFIPKGSIVSTIGRHPASRQFFEASGDGTAPLVPIVVLINGGSASSSEIVAAALQDVGRAVIVGSASYGKGTVQTVLRLPNDGELTLTWAQLVTPAGYFLHEHGVIPTLCTSDLSDDDNSVQIALQRTNAFGSPALRPRASLDEGAWSQLRRSCPPRQGDHEVDIKVAKRLLADPTLFNRVVHALSVSPKLAAVQPAPPMTPADPALTGGDGSLLSGQEHH